MGNASPTTPPCPKKLPVYSLLYRSCTFSNASVLLGRQGLHKHNISAWKKPGHLSGKLHASNCGNQSVVIPGPGLPGPVTQRSSSSSSSNSANVWGERG